MNYEERKEYYRMYYQNNKERIKKVSKLVYENNTEKIKIYQRQYYKDNKEKIIQRRLKDKPITEYMYDKYMGILKQEQEQEQQQEQDITDLKDIKQQLHDLIYQYF
jgi:hypothetical protein